MTNLPSDHLTEDERQGAADGTLAAGARARVDAHRATCRDCDDDVARLAALVKHMDESRRHPMSAGGLDELWPEIRRRIDGSKVVSLDATAPASRRLRVDAWWIGLAAGVLAIIGVSVYRIVPPTVRSVATTASADSIFRLASDSVQAYQAQADALLDELKLARLAPETRASIDDDLKTIDLAIAEVQAAIARDPKNPTLRSMLASSYRQKVDVLKKISNAS